MEEKEIFANESSPEDIDERLLKAVDDLRALMRLTGTKRVTINLGFISDVVLVENEIGANKPVIMRRENEESPVG